MAVEHLTEADFASKTGTGVVLVDFWAPWCGPCRALGPVLDELAKDLGDKVVIGKVNCDEEAALAQKFNIRSIPALFVLKDGQVVKQFVGAKGKEELKSALNAALVG